MGIVAQIRAGVFSNIQHAEADGVSDGEFVASDKRMFA
jgi:hypothetical protein